MFCGKVKLLYFLNMLIFFEGATEILIISYKKNSVLHCLQNIGMTSSIMAAQTTSITLQRKVLPRYILTCRRSVGAEAYSKRLVITFGITGRPELTANRFTSYKTS